MRRIITYCFFAVVIAGLAAALPDPLEVKPPKLFLKLWMNPANMDMAQLYWMKNGKYSEVESEKSTIYDKDRFISLKFMLPTQYERLRFDPQVSSGDIQIKDIQIVDIDDKPVRKIAIDRLAPKQQISDFKIDEETANASMSMDANDPYLEIDDYYEFKPPPWWIIYKTNIHCFWITFVIVIILSYLADLSDKYAELEEQEMEREQHLDSGAETSTKKERDASLLKNSGEPEVDSDKRSGDQHE